MINFENLSAGELYEIGKQLGVLSQTRPDIAHRLILGYWDGLSSWGNNENLGSVLCVLQNQGMHHVPPGNLCIPFAPLKPAGAGAK